MSVFVQFGAGNIGRSFIGRLFAEAGYEVVFVDVDARLVGLLNERGSYPVVVRQTGRDDQTRIVERVRAVDGRDADAVIRELVRADYAACSVGKTALGTIIPLLARGLSARKRENRPALDLIIAENIRDGADFFRKALRSCLSEGDDTGSLVGLVETSIGKMVPIMPAAALAEDPLRLFTEPYDTLFVDRRGFRNALPPLAGLRAVDNVAAYVDRKSFMHNMSHVAVAYLGWKADPGLRFIWQAMEIPAVAEAARAALSQSASALRRRYPADFTIEDLTAHGEDLLERYRNRALADTLHRVGRDLARKLSRDDRLIGACLLAAGRDLPFDRIAAVANAALGFGAPDEQGRMSVADSGFLASVEREGARAALTRVAALDPEDALDSRVLDACLAPSS